MSKSLNTLIAGLLLASTGHAFAASSVDLSVKGSITPSACTPTLSNSGVIDHGKLSAKDLSPTSPTTLGISPLTMEVSCDAATLFALRGIDNRAATSNSIYNYGLGLINGTQKLGWFWMTLENPIADNDPVRLITSWDGSTWSPDLTFWYAGLWAGFAAADDLTLPIAIQKLTAQIKVRTVVVATNSLDLSNEVAIDGSATMEVKYL
ncbi:DUF1120 domain-containing protein [Pseudomonas sp. Marseille-Q1929]|uniref:DUF1120 domain-containing protein n=1 Tax=Pseudomonas sp. Marseille-Q1929 TaxID=2730402 RepID=UPI001A8C6094|nr:DUF1120 domain-containing protein [Pseudomonas sp. Marseille-Q1929]MBO0491821.1 DUF1120 domain-containing protein [Pseudomonas sp. Marseille-Q1929]